jgi:D-lactate dehydrogenase (cytochrome)/glycolate oxidase
VDAGRAIEEYAAACGEAGYVAHTTDPAEGEQFLVARREALPALERQGATLLDDVAVPKPAMATMIDRIQEIAQRHQVVVGTFGHAGDGNLHPTIVFQPQQLAAARAAFDEIVHAALDLGGTITGEHGVGSLKTPYLPAMLGKSEQALMARIKAGFDPMGILNPGKAI